MRALKGVDLRKIELERIHKILVEKLSITAKKAIRKDYPGFKFAPVTDTKYGIIIQIKIMLAAMEEN